MINHIKNKLDTSNDYKFLKEMPNKIILLTLGGSLAYGTNNENSDIDIRGAYLKTKEELLGFHSNEQIMDHKTDTTIYNFEKFIKLLLNCNPNTIEMLGVKPEHILYKNEIGDYLIKNKQLFLSKKAIDSFYGYANQQLRRMENALAHDTYEQKQREKHILGSCKSAMKSFDDRYRKFDNGSIILHTEKSQKEDFEEEIMLDVNIKNYPLRDYKNITLDLQNIAKEYDKLNKRNRKKDANHLNKHAMHLIRLHLMCIDILEYGEINTYREHEQEFLLSIRNGYFQNLDGSYKDDFFKILTELQIKTEKAMEKTKLNDLPNYKEIEKFVINVNERIVRNEI